jgi:hypothetical protein
MLQCRNEDGLCFLHGGTTILLGETLDLLPEVSGNHRPTGIAMHFFARVEGSVHDLDVFRRTLNDLYRLLEDHPNEPTKILVDKGYIGFNDSPLVKVVTPHKRPLHGFLSDAQLRSSQQLSSIGVVVENYFG